MRQRPLCKLAGFHAVPHAARWRRFAMPSGEWMSMALDLAFPPACASCRVPLSGGGAVLLCADCREAFVDRRPTCARCGSVAPGTTPSCPRCREARFFFEKALRLGAYDGPLRAAVLRTKNQFGRGLAIALGDLLAARHADELSAWKPDAVVPVPMHWSRRMWRGGNSPQVVAERLAARLGIPLASHLLARRRRTALQASLPPSRRAANVRGAFRARAHRDLPGSRLLLVDDVMTTGATLNEASRTLSRAGAGSLAVAVLARAEGVV